MLHEKAPRGLGRLGPIFRQDVGLTLGLLSFVLTGLGAGPEARRFEYVETHMGSPFKMILYTDDAALASRASRAAFDRIKSLDDSMSDYNPESELSRLCDKAGGLPVPISADLFDILTRSKRMAERTEGAFDPTIAPVGRLWRRARRDRKLPDPKLLARAQLLVGHDRLVLDPKDRTARLTTPGMRLDLGAIAKGYASQAAIDVLKQQGVRSALVGGAGDIVVSEAPPGTQGWKVEIAPLENPEKNPPERTLMLSNAAISTSGDAERFVEIGGVRYSHILDPKTGIGLTERMSITVVSTEGATSDALDTSVCILGPEKGLKLVEETPGASCLIIKGTGAARKVWESKGFPAGLKK